MPRIYCDRWRIDAQMLISGTWTNVYWECYSTAYHPQRYIPADECLVEGDYYEKYKPTSTGFYRDGPKYPNCYVGTPHYPNCYAQVGEKRLYQ